MFKAAVFFFPLCPVHAYLAYIAKALEVLKTLEELKMHGKCSKGQVSKCPLIVVYAL